MQDPAGNGHLHIGTVIKAAPSHCTKCGMKEGSSPEQQSPPRGYVMQCKSQQIACEAAEAAEVALLAICTDSARQPNALGAATIKTDPMLPEKDVASHTSHTVLAASVFNSYLSFVQAVLIVASLQTCTIVMSLQLVDDHSLW